MSDGLGRKPGDPETNSKRTRKWMVGRRSRFLLRDGLFSGAMLNFGRVRHVSFLVVAWDGLFSGPNC